MNSTFDLFDIIEFFTNYTKMPIMAFSSLLSEKRKNSSDKMLPSAGIEPRLLITCDSKSNTLISELARHVLLRTVKERLGDLRNGIPILLDVMNAGALKLFVLREAIDRLKKQLERLDGPLKHDKGKYDFDDEKFVNNFNNLLTERTKEENRARRMIKEEEITRFRNELAAADNKCDVYLRRHFNKILDL